MNRGRGLSSYLSPTGLNDSIVEKIIEQIVEQIVEQIFERIAKC